LITISGEPGSGKTTVARRLAERLGLPHVYAGDLYRQEARRRGLSLEEFNRLCERDHSIDRTLDAAMGERARQGNVVLEGRLAGYLAAEAKLPSLKVWLTAADEVRARRVAERENGDWRSVLEINEARHSSDAKRYQEIYGWDLADTRVYDIVLSTDDRSPEDVVERLAAEVEAVFGESRAS
jgi:predicted cytidylate kinase